MRKTNFVNTSVIYRKDNVALRKHSDCEDASEQKERGENKNMTVHNWSMLRSNQSVSEVVAMSYCRSKHYALFRDKNAKCKHTPASSARTLRTWLEWKMPPPRRDSVLKSRGKRSRTSREPRNPLATHFHAARQRPHSFRQRVPSLLRSEPCLEVDKTRRRVSSLKIATYMCLTNSFRNSAVDLWRVLGRVKRNILRDKSSVLRRLCK